jgi:hypothetical protein
MKVALDMLVREEVEESRLTQTAEESVVDTGTTRSNKITQNQKLTKGLIPGLISIFKELGREAKATKYAGIKYRGSYVLGSDA